MHASHSLAEDLSIRMLRMLIVGIALHSNLKSLHRYCRAELCMLMRNIVVLTFQS